MSVVERQAVITEAKTWLRTPYHHEACVKGGGVDCAYLLIGVYSAVGLIKPFKPDHYPPDWAMHRDTERYLSHVLEFAHETTKTEPGNVILFRVGRCFSHAAIIVDWPRIIHASNYDRMVSWGDATKDHRLTTNRDNTPREHVIYSYWPD